MTGANGMGISSSASGRTIFPHCSASQSLNRWPARQCKSRDHIAGEQLDGFHVFLGESGVVSQLCQPIVLCQAKDPRKLKSFGSLWIEVVPKPASKRHSLCPNRTRQTKNSPVSVAPASQMTLGVSIWMALRASRLCTSGDNPLQILGSQRSNRFAKRHAERPHRCPQVRTQEFRIEIDFRPGGIRVGGTCSDGAVETRVGDLIRFDQRE